jgi:hypothetical protein
MGFLRALIPRRIDYVASRWLRSGGHRRRTPYIRWGTRKHHLTGASLCPHFRQREWLGTNTVHISSTHRRGSEDGQAILLVQRVRLSLCLTKHHAMKTKPKPIRLVVRDEWKIKANEWSRFLFIRSPALLLLFLHRHRTINYVMYMHYII